MTINRHTRRTLLLLIALISTLHISAQLPAGAQKTFHFKIQQESRFGAYNFENSALKSKIITSNGLMLEIAIKRFTLSASKLVGYKTPIIGANKANVDVGYEYNITKTIIAQPFFGLEITDADEGFSTGVKINKNLELFEHINYGIYAGLRYSDTKSYDSDNWIAAKSKGCISASVGLFFTIYEYKRPTVRTEW